MKLIYVAGKYTDPRGEWYVQENLRVAMAVACRVWQIPGLAAVCPHGNTAHMGGAVAYDKFMEGDLEIIERLDAVLMLPDWEESRGARMEHDHARRLGKPVYFWPHDHPKLWCLGRLETDPAAPVYITDFPHLQEESVACQPV